MKMSYLRIHKRCFYDYIANKKLKNDEINKLSEVIWKQKFIAALENPNKYINTNITSSSNKSSRQTIPSHHYKVSLEAGIATFLLHW